MGCAASWSQAGSTPLNITSAVLDLQRTDQRDFLGYGVFETTAVIVALFVTGFALVRDPTGMQHAHDMDEYSVYTQWRLAMCFLIGDVIFTAGVVIHQVLNCWTGKHVLWLLALMLAPWAPLAGKVKATLFAWPQVRSMMRSRAACNSLTAVMREGLFLGYPGLSTRAAGKYVFGIVHPKDAKPEYLDVPSLDGSDALTGRIEHIMATSSGLPLTKAALLVGPQLKELSIVCRYWYKLEGHLDCILDPVASCWTHGGLVLPSNPFEHLTTSSPTPLPTADQTRSSSPALPTEKVTACCRVSSRTTIPIKLVRILDVIDRFQLGGTVSEARYIALQSHAVCPRCIMAVRAAVETFLESSSRQHSGVRAKDWFKGVVVQWCGGVDVCLGVLWDCCFADNTGMRLDGDPRRGAESGQTGTPHLQPVNATNMTSWFLLFLFLLSRSLLGEATALKGAGKQLHECLDQGKVFGRFWKSMETTLRRSSRIDDNRSKAQTDRAVEQLMRDALAAMVDDRVAELLQELSACLIDTADYHDANKYLGLARLCDVTTCILHLPTSMATFTRLPPPAKRRQVRPRTPAGRS